ncbi:unnamed protein product [Closterium sp. NIES-53]
MAMKRAFHRAGSGGGAGALAGGLQSRALNLMLVAGDCFFIGMQPILVFMSKVDGKFLFNPISVNFLSELFKLTFAIIIIFFQVGCSALCPLPSCLCLLPSALCLLPSALCPLPSGLSPLPSALCPLPSALCPLPSLLSPLPSPLSPLPSPLSPLPSPLSPLPSPPSPLPSPLAPLPSPWSPLPFLELQSESTTQISFSSSLSSFTFANHHHLLPRVLACPLSLLRCPLLPPPSSPRSPHLLLPFSTSLALLPPNSFHPLLLCTLPSSLFQMNPLRLDACLLLSLPPSPLPLPLRLHTRPAVPVPASKLPSLREPSGRYMHCTLCCAALPYHVVLPTPIPFSIPIPLLFLFLFPTPIPIPDPYSDAMFPYSIPNPVFHPHTIPQFHTIW